MATQEYLDEAKTPSVKTVPASAAAVATFRPEVGEIRRQVALWIDELAGAQIAETDAGLLDLLRQEYDYLRAMENAVTDATIALKQLVEMGRLWKTKDTEIRAYITSEGLGYTV